VPARLARPGQQASKERAISYYDRHATEFFTATVSVEMAPLYARFMAGMPCHAHILDAGCGSGRDAKAFADAGFRVSAFDASPKLAQLARAHCGFDITVRRFEDMTEAAAYDAIWCCASLLHVPVAEMPVILYRLWRALRPGGRLYASFKHGQGEREHGGRRFTDANEVTLRAWCAALEDVQTTELWITADQRPDREEQWINAVVTRRVDG
jgi:2-polyprenyl-3-methyl-5-hydroxy-6-metoxy-1,4-benzoquinol methylase